MVTILSDTDKATVKRVVPKETNKIQAVGVARLYVAYPNRSKWTYTGLQGAVVLANDLVGNTYWLKMVDVSPSNRGVIWDQEIFDTWTYNQDRTFFHTFELEECLAGLSFVDEKEAALFMKKMQSREKHASRATKATPFGGRGQPTSHKHGFLGLGGIFGGSRHSSAPTPPDSPGTVAHHSNHHSRVASGSTSDLGRMSEFALLDAFDPRWRENFGHYLSEKGLNDDFIKENQEFIVDFLREERQKQASAPTPPTNGHEPSRAARPPPPPPPAAAPAAELPATAPRRNVPPAPPPPRRGKTDAPARGPSPPTESAAPPLPPAPRPRYNAPPPLADAGKFAHMERQKSAPSAPGSAASSGPGPGSPSTPAARKRPRASAAAIAAKGTAGTPSELTACPTSTRTQCAASSPSAPDLERSPASSPTPVLERSPSAPTTTSAAEQHTDRPTSAPSAPLPPPSSAPVAPPPPPNLGGPPAPPPPPMPNRDSGYSSGVPPAAVASDPGRAGLLESIQKTGGIGGLKKVDRSQIRDRSAVAIGGTDSGPHGSGLPPAGVSSGGQATMADALAAALQKRKGKVSKSDDEDDDDDW
ncbi:related to component of actin cortical patches LAS17 [Cephalotrichum gorgonifer]|uniref:Related to component of actin cortical patches LAS17 n=1 Tax=Cephalotrichum gorgonifer TaxID=2041049 RepID=A0AAE8MUD4_9PEZI|nr:related to component of actin cortical patches LAS17 [Cephalotrichum gorgonifer]